MKPRIAVTADVGKTPDAYVRAVQKAGGNPFVLQPLESGPPPANRLADADGLLLAGGRDLDPALWGETKHPKTRLMDPRRQEADLALLEEANARGLPVLAVCLGIQELAVYRGGTLIQHVPDVPNAARHDGTTQHPVTHVVTIEADSLLARIVGPEPASTAGPPAARSRKADEAGGPLETNSRHHQAVREPGRGMRIVARSADGLIEAVESEDRSRFGLGVQWHAEDLISEPRHLALFKALCEWARAYASERRGDEPSRPASA
ncbi:MAG: gamma-glutamyl-gamma-aminobutyrate hydrolase family protein [Phycisphaerae bacterium]